MEIRAAQYSCAREAAKGKDLGRKVGARLADRRFRVELRKFDMMNQMQQTNRVYPIGALVILVLYAGARLFTAPPILEKPRSLADTVAYARISAEPIYRLDFWAGARPAAFPLLLKIAGQDYNRAAALQLLIGTAAWAVLAWMASRSLKSPWLQLAGFAVILLFSLDRHIASWDFVMMSESLSVSFLALFIAAGLWLLQGWRTVKVVAFLLAAFLLAFTRDTNAWMLLALAVLVALATALRWAPSRSLLLSAGLVLIFVLGIGSAMFSARWGFPLGNVITQRILSNPASLAYFESCGMPISTPLLQLSGKYANSDDGAMFAGVGLGPFRDWLRDRGTSCYAGWLMANPFSSVRETFYEAGGLVAFATVDRYFSNRYTALLPPPVAGILYPESSTLWIWGYTTLAALAVIWKRAWRDNVLWAAFVCLTILIFPHLYLTWHGDAMAPDRHALSVGVQLYLAFWILNLMVIYYVLAALRRGR